MAFSSGVRFRAYPKAEQAMLLSQWIGCQRFVYNAKVREDRYFRTYRTRSLALTGQPTPVDQQYAQFKSRELTHFLYDVPSQVLRNGAYRFMQAYCRFFKKLSGRPAIKKKRGRQTVLLTKELFEFIPTGVIRQTSLGESIKEHLLFIGTHKHPVGFLKSAL